MKGLITKLKSGQRVGLDMCLVKLYAWEVYEVLHSTPWVHRDLQTRADHMLPHTLGQMPRKKLEPQYFAGRNIKWCSLFGKQFECLNIESPQAPAVTLSGRDPTEQEHLMSRRANVAKMIVCSGPKDTKCVLYPDQRTAILPGWVWMALGNRSERLDPHYRRYRCLICVKCSDSVNLGHVW